MTFTTTRTADELTKGDVIREYFGGYDVNRRPIDPDNYEDLEITAIDRDGDTVNIWARCLNSTKYAAGRTVSIGADYWDRFNVIR